MKISKTYLLPYRFRGGDYCSTFSLAIPVGIVPITASNFGYWPYCNLVAAS